MLSRIFLGSKRELSILEEEQMQSPFRTVVRNFRQNKIAMIGSITFLVIFLSCFILPIFYPLDTTYQDVSQQNIAPGFTMTSVPNELKNNVAQISGGATFGVGIDKDGKYYSWGQMDKKLLKVPTNMGKLTMISAGLNHVLAVNDRNEVFTWGYDRLGLDMIPIELNGMVQIKQIVAGYQMSFVVSEDGELYWWGNQNILDVNPGDHQGNIEKIAANSTTAIALLKDGSVAALSSKETIFSKIPQEIQGNVVDVASTDNTAAALTKDGKVYVWGSDDYGQKLVPESAQGKIKSISAGRYHYTAILEDGSVIAWGRDNFGQTKVPSVTNAAQVTNGYYQNYIITEDGKVLTSGLSGYLMGTDGFGRDIFTRLIAGGRMTMTIGAISVIISVIIGVIIGGFSGYYGGKVDNILMRLAEIVASIPFLPFAMILSVIVGNSLTEIQRIAVIMVILGVLSWPPLARLVRAQILAEREKEFVTAAKAMGIKEWSIIFKHILPNVITVVIVDTTLAFASCMLIESSLSFLGFGVVEPTPTWGNMLNGSQASTVIQNYWWRWVFPSLALSLSTISINLIGDGLRDAIDPRSNDR
ncbi:ABC transporter permease subunit [Phocea massiliensis]|uniref:ABC transporter permease subunit n=2 Tax=Merdimmobilis hominis TaxID=2897707 RepID=A0A938X7D4_9FIRM|nr:ABC transporter permease subunit [Merdimmobilis hominis]